MIDHNTIQRIIDTAEIIDVIQDFVSLKKRGVNYLGLCPFHNEKTPSFTVSAVKGIYKCFGCGKGGNAVNFIMEHEHLGYPEALKYLAKKYNIDVVEKELTAEEIQQQNERDSLLVVSKYANTYYQDKLHKHTDGRAIGLSYFKERGFRDEIIQKFELGFSLDIRDAFTKAAIENGYKLEFLEKAGFTIVKDDDKYDRFRGRVMFPIHGLSGNVIGFGGRVLKKDEKTAKYLNSPESEIYHKSKVLYGMFQAKTAITQADKCYLVEGYTDVISMHQSGIENVVASSGTSLTIDQIRLIKRFTPNVTIIYDGDAAGIKASLRGIDLVLEQGLNVRVLLLPDGEDPDSFAKSHSASELIDFITKNEEDFIKFKTRLLSKDAKNDPVKKASLITDIVRSISVIPDGITRTVYIKECSRILDIDEKILYSESNKIRRKSTDAETKSISPDEVYKTASPSVPSFIEGYYAEHQERELIRLLLHYGPLVLYTYQEDKYDEPREVKVAEYIISEILNDDLEFKNLIYKQIFQEYLDGMAKKELPESKQFIYHTDQHISKLAADLLSPGYTISKIFKKGGVLIETEEMKLKQMVPETIVAYKRKILEIAQQDISEKLKDLADKNLSNEEINTIQKEYMQITTAIRAISKDRGWVVFR
ncbi:MAG: DNA primase [Bacteroidetes bacterium GWF2_33_16]|nr:MAG: DNA primase [Bacteroidetes bacterium GWE2_32_14]OFY04078.1 MAG: DNA primase [Bacteroidetes bacterium GWF2_33_16]